jgi:hypothetical protein
VAQALAQGLRNLLESGQAEIGEARVLAGQARAFGRLATVAPRSSRLATVAPRSSSYGDRRGPREVFLIISVATARIRVLPNAGIVHAAGHATQRLAMMMQASGAQ